MNKSNQANLIKLMAVVTAAARWVGALLASEGFEIPPDWLGWWIPLSAALSLGMAVIEGWAFAFIFSAWRNQKDEGANNLLVMALLAAIVFVIVLTPFIVAQVQSATLATTLAPWPWATWLWGAAVAASTIVIVAGVGYAQKELSDEPVITQEQWESLQAYAEGLTAELEQAQAALETAQADTARIAELEEWRATLRSFDVRTKQGVAAMISFAHNGNTPTQAELAQAIEASETTVRLGKQRATIEAQERLPGINGE